MDRRKAPLRRVLYSYGLKDKWSGFDALECGHHVDRPVSFTGAQWTERKRCPKCYHGVEPEFATEWNTNPEDRTAEIRRETT